MRFDPGYFINKENGDAAQKYKGLSNQYDMKEFLARFILDPSSCGLSATTSTSAGSSREDKTTEQWVTFNQLKSTRFLNSDSDAQIMIAGMESRPHAGSELMRKAFIGWCRISFCCSTWFDLDIIVSPQITTVTTDLNTDCTG